MNTTTDRFEMVRLHREFEFPVGPKISMRLYSSFLLDAPEFSYAIERASSSMVRDLRRKFYIVQLRRMPLHHIFSDTGFREGIIITLSRSYRQVEEMWETHMRERRESWAQ